MPSEAQFGSILAEYQDKVFRLCCAMLGDRGLAEETAQDVFVRIWKALPRYRGDSSLSTWIYAITRNACLAARKASAVYRGLSLEIPAVRFAAERVASPAQLPDRSPDVWRFVAELAPQYREVVLLFYMQGQSYDDVALMLGLPLGTVKTYLHRARKQLAEALAGQRRPTMQGARGS